MGQEEQLKKEKSWDDLDFEDIREVIEKCEIPIPIKTMFPLGFKAELGKKGSSFIQVLILNKEGRYTGGICIIERSWAVYFVKKQDQIFDKFFPLNMGAVIMEFFNKGYTITE